MSQKLIDRSPDLKRLRDEGFDIAVRDGYLLVRQVPYLNEKCEVKRGILITDLTLANDKTVQPADHVVHFAGEFPCHKDGRHINEMVTGSSGLRADDVVANWTCSAKPGTPFPDYYAKMSNYVAILGGPARVHQPDATARVFPVVRNDENDESVFVYTDTASSRAEIVETSRKLGLGKVAIVGLGGTGSYVLDLLAKTPIKEIHLFDGDTFLQHNAFRAPGAASGDDLGARPFKVDYYAKIYGNMRRGIVAHPTFVTAANLDKLTGMDFVFLTMEGKNKSAIVTKLEELGIRFIDVGMGLYHNDSSIGGLLRVTTSTPENRDQARTRISLSGAEDDDEYDKNIQIADLNALNAALAVIKWKKLCGFYFNQGLENNSSYMIGSNALNNSDASA